MFYDTVLSEKKGLKMAPKVSVIVPVYNVETYLYACLDSLLSQTFTDFEVLCVNDGSTDNSLLILQEYAKKDPRIRVITQENQGLSMARNNGVKQARGKYIYFLDSDDIIHPQLLEICWTMAETKGADFVCFSFIEGQAEGPFCQYDIKSLPYKETQTPLFFQKKRHKWKISVHSWNKFYKRELLDGIEFIPRITTEDVPYTYMVLLKKPKTVILNIPLYYHTYNPTGIIRSPITVPKIKSWHTSLDTIQRIYTNRKERAFVLKELMPNMLKQQLNLIKRAPVDKQPELFRAFAEELIDLKNKKCLKWRGHKISRYFLYQKLIREFS